LHVETDAPLLFCENETNTERLWGQHNPTPYVKDGINDAVVHGRSSAVNPEGVGTKASADIRVVVPAGEDVVLSVRLTAGLEPVADPFDDVEDVFSERKAEADAFYEVITPPAVTDDAANVMRQALAGMLWTKQYYEFDLDTWLQEHDAHPLRSPRKLGARNTQWFHMVNDDVISMPDKWEYPWYAAWDLAFHTIALSMVDPDFARSQLDLMLSEVYQHPSGQIPAYEWNFGDVNPPVHAFATLLIYNLQQNLAEAEGETEAEREELVFLREAFSKLLVNFTWWVNRKDATGNNVFEGGFLGLDNIGVFDRSAQLPTGGHLEQADATGWMALFSQNMLELSLAMAEFDASYEGFVMKFMAHFFWIAAAMDPVDNRPDELWDEEDGFFYDVLRLPDGSGSRLKVRSLVGLLPLCATIVVPGSVVERFPHLMQLVLEYLRRNRDLLVNVADPLKPGVNGRHLLSVLNEDKLRRVLARMLDEDRFLGPHGIRSLSKWHEEHPFEFDVHGEKFRVAYEPAESRSGMFGGNSNWRGPVWFPVNMLILRALLQMYLYYGDDFRIECPTGSGNEMTLFEVVREIGSRLISTFTRDENGHRPVYGGTKIFQEDPAWNDLILFYEYFHGDNGAGLGASHQTGWTGVVARLIQLAGAVDAETMLHGIDRPMTAIYRRPPAEGG
jgi:hypothetical protein